MLTSKYKYNVFIVFLLLLRWDMGKVRDRYGLRYKGWVNSIITNVNI